jgi:N6-adenosine-specific RNA methylase IME4
MSYQDIPLDQVKNKYEIIYADPAWSFSDRNTGGSFKSGSSQKYIVMSTKEILAMPVQKIAAKDAFLFLWIPDSLLDTILHVIFPMWGFKYKKKAFEWIKLTKTGKDFMGLGHTTRNGCEDLYLGIRGHPKVVSHSVRQVVYAPIEKHSKKPDLFKEKIMELCGKKKRIELFARQRYDGWHCWGNEVK